MEEEKEEEEEEEEEDADGDDCVGSDKSCVLFGVSDALPSHTVSPIPSLWSARSRLCGMYDIIKIARIQMCTGIEAHTYTHTHTHTHTRARAHT